MSQASATKLCKLCGMNIPDAAKKCPYCHHWQRWAVLSNPQFTLILYFPILLLCVLLPACFITTGISRQFREWEPFVRHAEQVAITESKMTFGTDDCGPAVVVVGKVRNLSPVTWKDVRFAIDFSDAKGQLFDAGQQESYTWRFPAGEESSFKISVRRQFPESKYADYRVRILSGTDARKQF